MFSDFGVSTARTQVDLVALAVEEDIVSGRIPPGSLLRQGQLAERFGVSRMPVREALRRLGALGLISVQPKRSVRVRTVSAEDLRDAFLVRSALEGLAAELAVGAITPAGMRELDAAKEDLESETLTLLTNSLGAEGSRSHEQTGQWLRANDRFHDAVLDAAGVPMLKSMAASVRRVFQSQPLWMGTDDADAVLRAQIQEHALVAGAILAGSPEAASAMMRLHIMNTYKYVGTVLTESTKATGKERARV